MLNSRLRSNFELLISLDLRTKSLIAAVEQMPALISDVKTFREQLDMHQDEIKGNLTTMRSLLDELEENKHRSSAHANKYDFQQALAYNVQQLGFLQDSYRKTIFRASRQLEAMERESLIRRLDPVDISNVDHLGDAYTKSVELTRDMTAYARRLAEEVKLGAANAELLEDSSSLISQNCAELKSMSGQMSQSKRLTSLAYRRRITSYVLYFLAFAFYFLSVLTIFLKRVPLGSWLVPSSYL